MTFFVPCGLRHSGVAGVRSVRPATREDITDEMVEAAAGAMRYRGVGGTDEFQRGLAREVLAAVFNTTQGSEAGA